MDTVSGVWHDARLIKDMLPLAIKIKRLESTPGANIASIWEETVKVHSGKTAIIFEHSRFTFGDLDRMSNCMAHWLESLGHKTGECICLMMENKPEFVAWWLAMAKCGIKVGLLNHNIKAKGLHHCISSANAVAIVFDCDTSANTMTVAPELVAEGKKLLFFGGKPDAATAGHVTATLTYDDMLNISDAPLPAEGRRNHIGIYDDFGYIYTSGTTGLPKAGIITHQRMIGFGGSFSGLMQVKPDDVVYTSLPIFHSAGGGVGIGMMVWSGCSVVLSRKFHASRYWTEVARYGCTVIQYIGEMARYLVQYAKSHPEILDIQHKVRVACGNGLRPDVWDDFQDLFRIPMVVEFYGATEGNGALFNRVKGKAGRGAVGRQGPLLRLAQGYKLGRFSVDDDCLVLDAKTGFVQESSNSEPGELLMPIKADRPDTTFKGYTDAAANKKKIVTDAFVKGDMYFRSGDLLSRDSKGYFYFVDRIGDTFRWKGENVSTTEVSEAAATFPGVEEANVYGVTVPGAADGRACMVALLCDDSVLDNLDAFTKHCSDQLPTYARPLFLRRQKTFDLTGTMKQLKTKLRDEGCDPSKMGEDRLLWFNPLTAKFETLTDEIYPDLGRLLAQAKRSKL
jgi:acyl-CoA synthetase (AMP-forming)/AMP-acid ligase II